MCGPLLLSLFWHHPLTPWPDFLSWGSWFFVHYSRCDSLSRGDPVPFQILITVHPTCLHECIYRTTFRRLPDLIRCSTLGVLQCLGDHETKVLVPSRTVTVLIGGRGWTSRTPGHLHTVPRLCRARVDRESVKIMMMISIDLSILVFWKALYFNFFFKRGKKKKRTLLLTCHPVLLSLYHDLFVGDVLFHF